MLWRERIAVRWQIGSLKAISFLLFARDTDLRPEVHGWFADRYFKLAALEEQCGHEWRAAQLRRIAISHEEKGPPDPYRPVKTAAMAMPVPQPPIFTDARGKLLE
jgi:hypothetical protein